MTTDTDCFNAALNKPKLLIIGHARHGKDTFADLIVKQMGLSFVSSSEFVGRRCIWPIWGNERYCSFEECFEDRVNYRSTWYNLITAYNTPDKSRTGSEMMKDFDLYVGMRNPEEFAACMEKKIFDHVIWVDASGRLPPEGKDSNGMTKEMANIWIDNNGPETGLTEAVVNLQRKLHKEGYSVNYTASDDEKFIVNPTTDEAKTFRMLPEDEKWTDAKVHTLEHPATPATEIEDKPVKFEGEAKMNVSFSRYQDDPGDLQELMDEADATPDQIGMPTTLGWETRPEDAISVLDHGFFKVLEVMGSDDSICNSARMSFGRGTKSVNSNKGLINYLVRNHHTSPLEMGEIRFHIRMPIFVMRQWVRHRTANLNEYSGRYSEMVRLFYVPCNAQICTQDLTNKQGSNVPLPEIEANNVGNDMSKICSDAFDVYENLLNRGVARETARMVLPLSTYTEVVWKLDVSNLIKFLTLRDDGHAQWEIQQYAKMVSKAVKEYFPLVYDAYLEQRQSKTLTMDEVRTLVTGDLSFVSNSQAKRISLLRADILS